LTANKPQTLDWVLLLVLTVFWGISFFFIKKGAEVFSPYQVGALRMSITAIFLMPILFFKKFNTGSGSIWAVIAVGVLGTGVPSVLFPFAMQPNGGISSSMGAIFNTLVPLFAFILAVIFLKQKVTLWKVLGLICGSVGVILLVSDSSLEFTKLGFFAIIGSFCYGISVTILKKYLQNYNPVRISAMSVLFLLPLALAYIFYSNAFEVVTQHPNGWQGLGYIAFLGIVSTGIANIIFFTLVQRTNTVFATTVTYMIPIVAIVVGFFDGEPVSYLLFGGLALILGAVYLVGRK